MVPQTRDYQVEKITFIVYIYQLILKQKHTHFGINQSAEKTYEDIALQLVYFMMFYIDPLESRYLYLFRNIIDALFVKKTVSYLPDY